MPQILVPLPLDWSQHEPQFQTQGTNAMNKINPGKILVLAVIAAALLAGGYTWYRSKSPGFGEGFASGNGRIEATEINVATKIAGRVKDILVDEGDFVSAGQVLVHMQADVLEAQQDEAQAQLRQAQNAIATARAQVTARQSDKLAAEAVVIQRENELDAAQKRATRTRILSGQRAASTQDLEEDEARMKSATATVSAAKAQVLAAQAAIEAAEAQVVGAQSQAEAVQATIARIKADIDDCTLKAPRDGRVQYRITQPGEVLGGGGKVLNVVDLSDVYLTFFLPETVVGRVALGSEVRLILDAAPQYVIPARISYVASVAQFTPKTVETESERQKLMFRVKAQIDRALLKKHLQQVKTGVPGVAWVKLDKKAEWPAQLVVKLPE